MFQPTTACNDNGSFFRRRGHAARVEAAGPICLNYVAPGVFLISSQEPVSVSGRRRRARAA